MKRMTLMTLLTILISVTLVPSDTDAIAQQAKSASLESCSQALKVLQAGVKAMGGIESLQAIADVTREMTGARSDQGQGLTPVLIEKGNQPPITNVYSKFTSIRDQRGQRAMDYRESSIPGGQPLRFRAVSTPNGSFSANYVTQTVSTNPPAALPSIRAVAFRRYPEGLLQRAWSRPETLRWLGEAEEQGRKQRVISFADADGAQVSLYFDAQTNLLTKSETLTDDPVLGDAAVEVVYSDWRPVGKVMLPFRHTDRLGGMILSDLRASTITLNTQPADGLFAPPDGFAKLEPNSPTPVVNKLADDVYALLGSYNSLFVVFKDYVLVLEGGANNRYSQAAISEIKKIAPDKPIRYMVSTHFHFDHVAGVRSYIAEGATIVTTSGAKQVIERAATASHLMRPDALSRNPRSPLIEVLKDKRVFDDGTHTVELYEFTSPHASEMVIAYLPKEKILFEGDLLDLDTPEGGTSPAGDDTADLENRIRQLGLNVERIVPVHGRVGSLNDLHRAVTNRSATSSKK